MQAGKSSIQFEHPPIITSAASIVGQTEGEGPLASFFDRVEPDPTFGKKSWEEAESELQRQTVQKCLDKAGRPVNSAADFALMSAFSSKVLPFSSGSGAPSGSGMISMPRLLTIEDNSASFFLLWEASTNCITDFPPSPWPACGTASGSRACRVRAAYAARYP